MLHSTATTTALLERLTDELDDAVWREFDERYRPILLGVLRRLGFRAEESQDVAQDTLLQFVRDFRAGRYDRSRGRLRTYLIGIARNRAMDAHRRRLEIGMVRGDSLLGAMPDAGAFEEVFEAESREHILCSALDLLRKNSGFDTKTLKAFERFALDGEPVARVAEDLELSAQAVYMAKHHCLARLKAHAHELRAAYELD